MIIDLALDGHDSELFSFITDDERDRLDCHRNADVPLWTFADCRDGSLISVTQWNGNPGCFVFTSEPRDANCDERGWLNWRGFVTRDPVCCVSALAFVRYEFSQFYTSVALDGIEWIRNPCDPSLERLGYIRGWHGQSTDSPEWKHLRRGCFCWAQTQLNHLDMWLSIGARHIHGVPK